MQYKAAAPVKDAIGGFPSLDNSLHLNLVRDGSNQVIINEKTSGEQVLKITRTGTNTYSISIMQSGAWVLIK